MPNVKLKKSVGDGGAAIDSSHGESTLYEVLKELADNPPETLSAYQAVVATGILATMVVRKATRLRKFDVKLAVCGTAGNTVVELRVNTVVKATFTIANTDADPTLKTTDIDVALAAGDVVDINVQTAPTGGTGLSASARTNSITVE